MTKIVKADISHLPEIANLFDAYRQFYEQKPDIELATRYIKARIDNNESVIYLAQDASGKGIGFTQLYPTFCSVAAQNVWVLYDLFVAHHARRQGVAEQLLTKARKLGVETKSAWLKLETGVMNKPGQALYEKQGWERDTEFHTYFLDLET